MSETRVIGFSKLVITIPGAQAWLGLAWRRSSSLIQAQKIRLGPPLYRRPKTWDVSVSIQPDNFFRPEKMAGLFVKEQLQRVTVCPESCLSCFLTLEPFLFPTSSLVPAWVGGSVPLEKTSCQSAYPVPCTVCSPLLQAVPPCNEWRYLKEWSRNKFYGIWTLAMDTTQLNRQVFDRFTRPP